MPGHTAPTVQVAVWAPLSTLRGSPCGARRSSALPSSTHQEEDSGIGAPSFSLGSHGNIGPKKPHTHTKPKTKAQKPKSKKQCNTHQEVIVPQPPVLLRCVVSGGSRWRAQEVLGPILAIWGGLLRSTSPVVVYTCPGLGLSRKSKLYRHKYDCYEGRSLYDTVSWKQEARPDTQGPPGSGLQHQQAEGREGLGAGAWWSFSPEGMCKAKKRYRLVTYPCLSRLSSLLAYNCVSGL